MEFLKANGLNKFSALKSHSTTVIKRVLDNARWNSSQDWKYHGICDIPYLDHAYMYKNSLGYGVLVYLPYIRYDKSLRVMTDEIRQWAESNNLRVVIVRESWYHPDSIVVIVTKDVSVMRDMVIKWNSSMFGGRMTCINHINDWNI